MADRFPIILNTSANQLQEIASGDTLDVSGAAVKANLVDSLSVVGTGVSVAGIVTATSFVGSGANLSGIDISAVKDSGGNVKIQAEASGAVYTGIHTFGSTTSFTNGVFNGTVTSTGAVVNGDSDLNGDIDVEGDLDVDGHTNLDNVSIAGVTTFTGNADFSSRIQITSTTPYIDFIDNNNNPDYRLVNANGTFGIYDIGSNLYRMLINTNGHIDFKTNVDCEAGLDVTGNATVSGDIDVDGHTNLDNVSIAGFTTITQDLNVDGHTNLDNVSIAGFTTITQDLDVDGHTNLDNVSVAGVTTFASGINCSTDGVGNGINIGAGSDLILQHNGTNSYIDNNTGDLYLQTTGSGDDIFIESADDFFLKVNGSDTAIQAYGGAYVELRNNNEVKLRTESYGIQVFDQSNNAASLRMNTSGGYAGALYAVNNNVIALTAGNYNFVIKGNSGGSTELYHTGNAKKLETTTTGITVTGNLVSTGADINGDIDVDGHTNLDNLSVAGVSTFTGAINGSSAAFSGNATITGNLSVGGVLTYEDVKNVDSVGIATARVGLKVLAGGANVVGVVTASNGIFVPDSQAIHLGNVSGGGDLQLTHNGSHSYIKDMGTGSLFIQGSQVALQSTSGENMVTAVADGAVQLMYDNSTKFATTNTGVSITGNIAVSGTVDGVDIASFKTSFDNLNTDLVADSSPQLGADLDTNGFDINFDANKYLTFANISSGGQIYHTGSHFYVWNGTGNTQIHADQILLKSKTGNETMLRGVLNGTVELYYDNSKKLSTVTNGIQAHGNFLVQDGYQIRLGDDNDAQLYHSGSNLFLANTTGYIRMSSSNAVYLDGNGVFIRNAAGSEDFIKCQNNGAVELYHNNNKKLETSGSGITVTGNATATTFIGALTGTASGNATISSNADNRVITGGSGNALTGESNVIVDSSRLMINGNGSGVSSNADDLVIGGVGDSGHRGLTIATAADASIRFADSGDNATGMIEYSQASNFMRFYVEGGEALRIEANRRVLIGQNANTTIGGHLARLQIGGTDYNSSTVSITNNTNDSNGAYLMLAKQRSGSPGGNTIVTSGDEVGVVRFVAADGNDMAHRVAEIRANVDGTPGTNDMPGRLQFFTTGDGGTTSTVRMTIKNTGRIGIGDDNPSEMLYVAGNIYATGNVTAYSDIRVKENVKEISNALEAVDKIRGVSYTRKDTKEDTLGVSAQEVETMFPELVVEDNHGMKSVNYNGLVGVLFSAVKELSTKLKEIENK